MHREQTGAVCAAKCFVFSGQKYPGSIHCQQLVFSFILLNYEKFHRVNKPACAQMLVCRGWPDAFQIGLEFGKSDSFFVVHSQCQWSSGSPWPSSKARLFSSCRLAGPSKSRLTLRRESRREATGGTPLGSYVYKHSVFIQFSLSVISYFLHLIRFGKAVAPVSSSLRKMHLEKRQQDFPSEITSAH